MASPCEILIQTKSKEIAHKIIMLTQTEAQRIELKYSRFLSDNIIYEINHANGKEVKIDQETYKLLHYAQTCYQLSEGLFDITSGILKSIWNFNDITSIPSKKTIQQALKNVGWNKVRLNKDTVTLPAKMQLDLGGIGKEYAVDSTVALIKKAFPKIASLINYGGDLCTTIEPNVTWNVGIDGMKNKAIQLKHGALATSGKTKQFFIHNNKRYSHIINPKTGWPIHGSPLSITVLAENTTQAGMLATFAQLQGENYKIFLNSQNVDYWINTN